MQNNKENKRSYLGRVSEYELFVMPKNKDEWRTVAFQFENRWNFPNCVAAIDRKHVVMQTPARSGSFYFNFKKTHSIVLMAVVNAKYEFTIIDVKDAGGQCDGGVFSLQEHWASP